MAERTGCLVLLSLWSNVTVRAIVKLITQVCEQLLPSKKSLRFNLRRGARRQEIEIIGSNIDKNAV